MKITSKLTAAAVAGALCFAMPTMAFAAQSAEKTDTTTVIAQVQDQNGKTQNMEVTVTPKDFVVPGAKDAIANFQIDGQTLNGKNAIITITAPKANTSYTIYIQTPDGKISHVTRTSDDNKKLTFTVSALPVNISLVAGGAAGAGNGNGNGTSPQTGMDLTAPIAGGVITLATAAGAAFVLRKKIAE